MKKQGIHVTTSARGGHDFRVDSEIDPRTYSRPEEGRTVYVVLNNRTGRRLGDFLTLQSAVVKAAALQAKANNSFNHYRSHP